MPLKVWRGGVNEAIEMRALCNWRFAYLNEDCAALSSAGLCCRTIFVTPGRVVVGRESLVARSHVRSAPPSFSSSAVLGEEKSLKNESKKEEDCELELAITVNPHGSVMKTDEIGTQAAGKVASQQDLVAELSSSAFYSAEIGDFR